MGALSTCTKAMLIKDHFPLLCMVRKPTSTYQRVNGPRIIRGFHNQARDWRNAKVPCRLRPGQKRSNQSQLSFLEAKESISHKMKNQGGTKVSMYTFNQMLRWTRMYVRLGVTKHSFLSSRSKTSINVAFC